MEPALSIVQSLGGVTALARYLKITAGAVSKWSTPTQRGGRGGLIPATYIPALCKLARAKGVFLEPNSFYRGHL